MPFAALKGKVIALRESAHGMSRKTMRSTILPQYHGHADDSDIRFGSRHLHSVEGTLVRHVPDLRSAEMAYLLPTAARSVSQPCGILRRRREGTGGIGGTAWRRTLHRAPCCEHECLIPTDYRSWLLACFSASAPIRSSFSISNDYDAWHLARRRRSMSI